MRARDVIGRTIVAIEQQRFSTNRGSGARSMVTHVYAIVLDDGTRLCPNVRETEIGDYAVEINAHKPETRGAK